MSNTCFTTYKITGKRADVARLHKTIISLDERETPLVENEWYNPKLCLGCLLAALGGDPAKVSCRGTITSYELQNGILTLTTESVWTEMAETRHFIESCFPDMKLYFVEEEEGEGIYHTNDAEGLFFKERFYLDSAFILKH